MALKRRSGPVVAAIAGLTILVLALANGLWNVYNDRDFGLAQWGTLTGAVLVVAVSLWLSRRDTVN